MLKDIDLTFSNIDTMQDISDCIEDVLINDLNLEVRAIMHDKSMTIHTLDKYNNKIKIIILEDK